jgi:hypothetical protein
MGIEKRLKKLEDRVKKERVSFTVISGIYAQFLEAGDRPDDLITRRKYTLGDPEKSEDIPVDQAFLISAGMRSNLVLKSDGILHLKED